MITPIVTELPRRLEPIGDDAFVEPPDDLSPAQVAADAASSAARRTGRSEMNGRSRPRSSTTSPASSDPDAELVALVHAARVGDGDAWRRLVERFDRRLRDIARSYRLAPVDVDDVMQATWLRLYRHIERVREPAAIAGWLATTTRRECLRLLQRPVQEELTDDPRLGDSPDPDGPEARLLAAERSAVLGRALATLPERHRRLMTLLAEESTPDYRHISASLEMPTGSIGPIRARSLARLARNRELRALALGGD